MVVEIYDVGARAHARYPDSQVEYITMTVNGSRKPFIRAQSKRGNYYIYKRLPDSAINEHKFKHVAKK